MTCQSLTSRARDERMLRQKVERDDCQRCSLSLPPSLPQCYISVPVWRCRSAEQLCQKLAPLWGLLRSPKEREEVCCSVVQQQWQKARGDEGSAGCWVFALLYRFPQSSSQCAESQSGAASAPAADESCTCCAHREQAQDSSLPPPPPAMHPPSCTPCALP